MSKSVALLVVLVVLTISCIVTSLPVQAEPKTIVVPDDYGTIQAAINAANEGDTIFVKKGKYEGPVNQTVIINKQLSLIGESTEDTTIKFHPPLVPMHIGTYEYIGHTKAIKIEANDVKIANLTITSDGGSISITGNATEIIGSVIDMPITATGDKIRIIENNMTTVTMVGTNQTVAENIIERTVTSEGLHNCIISNKIIGSSTEGAVILKGSANVVYGNNIVGDGYGVAVRSNSSIVAGNILTDCGGISINRGYNNIICTNRINDATGIMLYRGDNNVIYANHLENNTLGIKMGFDQSSASRETSGPKASNNTVYHNNFIQNTEQAIDWNWIGTNHWDNGEEGNYWSDYSGSDWNFDGIGDSPYMLSEAVSHYAPSTTSTDLFPLMAPFDISSVSVELPEWTYQLPFQEEQSTPEPFPTVLVATSIVSAAAIGVGLLVYFKKRKR